MFRRLWIGIAMGLAFALTAPSHVFATSSQLRDGLAKMAKEIIESTKGQPVSIGQFTPTKMPASNAGTGIEQILKAELEHLHPGVVQMTGLYEIKGDYILVPSISEPAMKEIKITIRIIESSTGDELGALKSSLRLDGTSTIAELVQLTGALPPKGDKIERNKEIQKRLEHPTVFIHGAQKTLISSQKNSPYAVQILVKPLFVDPKSAATPREARVEGGQAYVEIQKEELYEVKLYNNSHKDVAAAVSIDGLDVFHFTVDRDKHNRPKYTHFIIGPKDSVTVVGWHHTVDPNASDNFLSFLVTELGKGAASQAGIASRGQIGVIHVQFADCSPLRPGSKARGGTETGFGPPRKVKQQPVRYQIEPPHDFVTIRYNR
jgi:hypothetical protein